MRVNSIQAACLIYFINNNLTNHSQLAFSLICQKFGYHNNYKFYGFHNYASANRSFWDPNDDGFSAKEYFNDQLVFDVENNNQSTQTTEPLFGIDAADMDEVYVISAYSLAFCDYNPANSSFTMEFKNTQTFYFYFY